MCGESVNSTWPISVQQQQLLCIINDVYSGVNYLALYSPLMIICQSLAHFGEYRKYSSLEINWEKQERNRKFIDKFVWMCMEKWALIFALDLVFPVKEMLMSVIKWLYLILQFEGKEVTSRLIIIINIQGNQAHL